MLRSEQGILVSKFLTYSGVMMGFTMDPGVSETRNRSSQSDWEKKMGDSTGRPESQCESQLRAD